MSTHPGPVEQLLEFKEEILKAQEAIRVRKLQLRLIRLFTITSITGTLSIYVATASTWRSVDMRPYNTIAAPLSVASIAILLFLLDRESSRPDREKQAVQRLELDLELAEERRRLYASQVGLSLNQRQYAYKEDIAGGLQAYRRQSSHYRRVHNAFQAVIIIGSYATTAAASFADTPAPWKWITVGISFSVGTAAGFTGYYKYRERGYYLQKTADDIEHQENAFDLGIYPYDGDNEDDNLARLAREVEALRVEQKRREQELDQPHEGRQDSA
ncbi:DUF4231 domain-containing protein [Streptomyces hesseae]|uniref:DUF4231 domain-containing protein n=1 Tax=Streptomyces hesseae TaxID=3075519 RepID=A0ABU2SMB2_9ACTN|nr:DUF4231 domain-containing protein [Streptomyces sp. DSM 40473]MDT0449928.1 DUF4231 domain-containing protein [Streptomyces sp. DSM 40473]